MLVRAALSEFSWLGDRQRLPGDEALGFPFGPAEVVEIRRLVDMQISGEMLSRTMKTVVTRNDPDGVQTKQPQANFLGICNGDGEPRPMDGEEHPDGLGQSADRGAAELDDESGFRDGALRQRTIDGTPT